MNYMMKKAETQRSNYTNGSMVSWLLGLAIRIPPNHAKTQQAVAEVCSIWAADLEEFSHLANGETLKDAVRKFKRWPTIADLSEFFLEKRGETRGETRVPSSGQADDDAALRNGLARKAMESWKLPIRGLGGWGAKCCEQWHLMQAVDAIRTGAILGGWDWSSGRCRIVLRQTIDQPRPSAAVEAVWRDETKAQSAYMGGTGGNEPLGNCGDAPVVGN